MKTSPCALVDLLHGSLQGAAVLCDLDGSDSADFDVMHMSVNGFLARSESYLHGPGPDTALGGERWQHKRLRDAMFCPDVCAMVLCVCRQA